MTYATCAGMMLLINAVCWSLGHYVYSSAQGPGELLVVLVDVGEHMRPYLPTLHRMLFDTLNSKVDNAHRLSRSRGQAAHTPRRKHTKLRCTRCSRPDAYTTATRPYCLT